MPSSEQHVAKASHNEAFLATFDLASPLYLDWAVTAIFYAALHYLRALMSRHRFTNISRYGDMDRAFDRLTILRHHPEIYDAYRQLKDDSRAARYDMWEPRPPEVLDLRDDELAAIKQFVLANL